VIRVRAALAALALVAAAPAAAAAQSPADVARFLGGAAAGFGIHEGGHLLFDTIFDADPELRAVSFGPFPFFAIAPTRPLSPRELYVVASAGLWTHAVASEVILERHPDLRHEHAPLVKGMLAFDTLTSVGYAMAAFAKAGPPERDTLGMATGLGVDERAIGALVLAPAVLDAYRYYHPDSTWARWLTRGIEIGSVALVLK